MGLSAIVNYFNKYIVICITTNALGTVCRMLSSPPGLKFSSSTATRQTWGNLLGSSAALMMANLAIQSQDLILLLVPDPLLASSLEKQLKFFFP